MIKITLEPNRLKAMLAQVLGYKKSAISDSSILHFTPEGVVVNCTLAGDVMVFAKFNKQFFQTLQVESEEDFMATTALLKELDYGFKGEKVTLQTDKEKIYITGDVNDDKAKINLEAINADKIAMFKAKQTDIGLIPYLEKDGEIKPMPFDFSVLVPVERFTESIPFEEVRVDFDGKDLSLQFKGELNERVRPIPFKKVSESSKPSSALFNFTLLQNLISLFNGEVWMSGSPKKLCLSQTNSDYSLTYVFASKQED